MEESNARQPDGDNTDESKENEEEPGDEKEKPD